VCACVCRGNRKALVEKSGLVKHAAGVSSSKARDAQSRHALSAEQQQRNTAHRSVLPPVCHSSGYTTAAAASLLRGHNSSARSVAPARSPRHNAPLILFLISVLYVLFDCFYLMLPHLPFSLLFPHLPSSLLIFSFENRPAPFPGRMFLCLFCVVVHFF